LMSNRDLFRRDGVHLNVNITCKFFRSLRGAVMSLLK
jgi:hypothetical protein